MSTYDEQLAARAYDLHVEYRNYAAVGREIGLDRHQAKSLVHQYLRRNNLSELNKGIRNAGLDPVNVKAAWIKTDEMSIYVRNDEPEMSYEEIRDSFIEEMQRYAPSYARLQRSRPNKTGHLLVIDPADVHIGKLCAIRETGYDYDIEVAEKRLLDGVRGVIDKASAYEIEQIVFVIGNDIIHIDHQQRHTTGKTPQDTSGQWWEMYLAAKMAYIKAIEMASEVADVTVVFCPSNHDRHFGFMLADSISSWFCRNPNISFGKNGENVSIFDRKYLVYGKNLLVFDHGDGAKEKDCAQIVQYEAREAWSKTKYTYYYRHHFHHKIRKTQGLEANELEKDYIGVTVINSGAKVRPQNNVYIEYVRSPSAPDAWHHRSGYLNEQAIEAFLHHPEHGQTGRFTHYF